MSDQVVRGSYALHFQLRFMNEIGILGIEQLEKSIGSDANQSAPGRVGMVWATSLYYAVVILVLPILTNGWPVCDVKLSMVRISERRRVWAGGKAYLPVRWYEQGQPVTADHRQEIVGSVVVPLPRDKRGLIHAVVKEQKTDPPVSVDDGQLRGYGRRPCEMDNGTPRKGRREDGARSGLAQLPRRIRRVGTSTLQVDMGAVRRDGCNGAEL